ncbi:unnamed protein product [Mytilus edulis]|uniref:Uncharacterized protein n=1 Tax=Mytilus edulis TaxID=6550 RepID=A0A8S3SVS3_MYTED|nr:unnamed protein product [Mytilus edulis]
MELIVYTLCVIGFLIIIGLSHFVRSYRKRSSINIPRQNGGEGIEMRPEIVEPAYIEIYDEIDEHLIAEINKEAAVTPQLRNINSTVSKSRTDKSTSSHDDTSSYLDPYFAEEETENPSTFKESSSSDSSNCDPIDHTGYLNPYQPLRERQQISDGYEVTVHVHKNSESSSRSESLEETSSSYKYSHVYQQLQEDQKFNKHEYERATKKCNEINIDSSQKNEIQDCRNKVSKDDESIDLLNKKETDIVDDGKGQLNEYLFFGQTIGMLVEFQRYQ